jgi:hypothetical protein
MPTASSVVCHLNTHQPPHQRIVYGLPSSAHQPHRGGGLREPQATLLPPSRLQQLQHLRQQFIRHIRPPAHRLPPPLCSQHRGNLLRDGEAAHRVSACHCPPVLVEVPALSTALAVWWVSRRRAWEETPQVCAVPPPRAALHPAAVSCAPCDTVHTHPAKHRPTASRALCALSHPPPPFDCTPPSALQRERRALRTTVQ